MLKWPANENPTPSSAAIRRTSRDEDGVNAQLAELFAFASRTFPPEHPFAEIEAMPSDAPVPPIWMLGSTSAGAAIAASCGLGFAFAGHFSMAEASRAIDTYRSRFRPTAALPSSRVILALTVVCGESDAVAEELAAPLRVAFARMATGARGRFPSLEEARMHRFTSQELAVVERFMHGAIVGGPARVAEGLERVARETGADELMISTVVPTPDERVRSYERIAALA